MPSNSLDFSDSGQPGRLTDTSLRGNSQLSVQSPESRVALRSYTVSDYLLARLKAIGVDHVFGVPGDFVLGFFNRMLQSQVSYVATCNELNAAYAADGYARIRGIGAIATTYGVGELSALNGVAGAFAERIPLVVITGAPATQHFQARPLLHHTLGDYRIPMKMFEKVTVASTLLKSGASAPAEIDRVLTACLTHHQPVYISLPSDVVDMPCNRPGEFVFPMAPCSDPEALREAIGEAHDMLQWARLPIVLGGVELIRLGLQREFAAFLDKSGLPFATMMLGKTVLSEHHPQFIGLFEGDRSREAVRQRVEAAECVLELGTWMTDFNSGGFTDHLADGKSIHAGLQAVRIRHHLYKNVNLRDFVCGMTETLSRREASSLNILPATANATHRPSVPYLPVANDALTVGRFFDRIAKFLPERAIVLAETGVSLFSAAETLMPEGGTFIGQTFYGSIGYTVGAALGAAIAAPQRPVVLLVGDGAFQVTGQELSTMIRNHLKLIIFLLNNDGYTIERVICDRTYNDLQAWQYHKLVEVYGGGLGLDVHTEGELEAALAHAATAQGVVFVEVHAGRLDCSDALRDAGRSMAATNQLNS